MIQNKYIIRVSFIGLLLNIIANIILYRHFMIEKIIIHNVANEHSKIANFYKQHVWDHHYVALSKLQNNNYKSLLQDQDFIKFAKHSLEFFADLKSRVSLFDMKGDKIITTHQNDLPNIILNNKNISENFTDKIDRYFLEYLFVTDGLEKAFKGISSNNLQVNLMLNDDGEEVKATIATSHIPIIDGKFAGSPIDSVLEISTDLTEQWNNIAYLEEKVLRTFIIIFSVFFIIILYNTNYAQRIINKQFEANRELEAAKTLAEKENISKSMFLANVTHELRTPLNAIIGFSEIILADKNTQSHDDNKHNEYIQDINNSGKHLLGIINDILDFSKACANRLSLDSTELDLNKLIISTIRFIKPKASESKVEIIAQLPQQSIVIKADPKRLKQVLLNLLSNAVKFTNENGSITAKVTNNALEKLAYIKIIDTGIGINEKDIPKALSVFGQIDSALSKKHQGTGLGLPLTKKLVELMGGQFDFKSIVGVGTVVTLTFKYHEISNITS